MSNYPPDAKVIKDAQEVYDSQFDEDEYDEYDDYYDEETN